MMEIEIDNWNSKLKDATPQEIINFFLEIFPNEITFGSSLGAEDQLITYYLVHSKKTFNIFTLDTGRLFPETYDLIDRTNKKYSINIQLFFPESNEIEKMVAENGLNLFYDSIENRKICCNIRKLNPLKRALTDKKAWFTGLRRSQSITRNEMNIVEWDAISKMLKINPLINLSENEVWDKINQFNIPFNSLHKNGYLSIGCQPCTRAVMPGEDLRAGRWWWESPDTKECGLHKK